MKYINKSFSIYANYATPKYPKCDACNQDVVISTLTAYGRFCNVCYAQYKEKQKKDLLLKISISRNDTKL